MPPSYELVTNHGETGIKCLYCLMTSWNPTDVAQRYCGYCQLFHDDLPETQARAEGANTTTNKGAN